ncbi:GLPGLI family protein [Amniculibacterium aquaticum]|uniref:GLPGLI family protein n=1 Tax=Amniculibacterium aquaticum TaxID=2479858 RepID=UPI000F5A821B|nr:GLPGLI family protein [Amniculibacterium aquaticum]
MDWGKTIKFSKFQTVLFIFLMSTNYLLCQEGIYSANLLCKYRISSIDDTLDVSTRYVELATLQIGEKGSLFRSHQKFVVDSIYNQAFNKAFDNASSTGGFTFVSPSVSSAVFEPEVFVNNGNVYIYDNIYTDSYRYKPVNKCLWKLINETKMISGHLCKKAEGSYGNRMVIAWYSNEIPIPEGPYNFKGLPGLILQIDDVQMNNQFLLISLEKRKTEFKIIENAIETTYSRFLDKRKEFLKSPVSYVKLRRKVAKEDEEMINKNLSRRNNFLD